MTDDLGSDAQLTERQRLEIQGMADLALAEAVEEDRRTAAAATDPD